MSYLIEPLAFIFVLAALVAVHELGHFLAAKYFGVGVIKFSIGFGPVLAKFRRKETQYQISAIPLGGYVRMVGDVPDAVLENYADDIEEVMQREETWPELEAAKADRSCWFLEKPLGQRAAIVFAGPLFNFIFAFFVYVALLLGYGVIEPENEPLVGEVVAGSPADEGGLQEGDRIVSIDGASISSWEQMSDVIRSSEAETLVLGVLREETEFSLDVTPREQEGVRLIGVSRPLHQKSVGLIGAITGSAERTAFMSYKIIEGVWGLVTGNVSPKELGGPIAIYKHTADSVEAFGEEGLSTMLKFVAFLSISLAVLNLLPIPVLDGGHLLMYLVEFLFGPISFKKRMAFQQVGFVILMLLMVYAFTNDIRRISNDDFTTSSSE